MARVQIANILETFANLRPLVYYKWMWSEPWRFAPDWEALTATWKATPDVGSATFRIRYGSGLLENGMPLKNGNILPSYNYCYVQIKGLWHGQIYTLWVGVVPIEHFNILGRSGNTYSADHLVEAYTLDWLLETRLEGAYVEPVGGGIPVMIDHLPTFNKRYEYGGPIVGNASYNWYQGIGYVFSDDGYLWTNWDILEYLLFVYQSYNGPRFKLSCNNSLYNALISTVAVFDFRSMTLRQAINTLLSPARGISWAAYVDNAGGAAVAPFSLLARPINFGGFVMPANPNRINQDLWNCKDLNVVVTADSRATFDKIVVSGEKMKSCATLKFADNTLQKAWSNSEETAYKDAAKNTPGYSELTENEKAELNDIYRYSDKFSRVYTTFRIPRNWDWKMAGQYTVNPQLDKNGKPTNSPAKYWNADKKILSWLPFLAGWDYTGSNPINNTAEGAEPEYQKPLVLVLRDNKYQNADTLKPFGASIRPLEREMGVEVKFSPSYMAAKEFFTEELGAEPGMHDGDMLKYGITYTSMIATVFLETDQIVKVWYNLNNYENKRILEIYIPHAELWYIPSGVVVGTNEEGGIQYYGGGRTIRDDTATLRAVMAAALAWYGREHNKVSITSKVLCPGLPVGTLIDNLDVTGVGAMGSVVTTVEWDFQNMQTFVATDFAEPDIARIFEMKKSKIR